MPRCQAVDPQRRKSRPNTNRRSIRNNDNSSRTILILLYPNNPPVRFNYPSVKPLHVAMPKVEITIPEHLEMQIAQLVEQGEFLNREEAIEDLLATGLKAYKTSGPVEDEEEPGYEDDGMMGHDDEYVF